jgi:predicted lipoprotein with Yx(FWY)xxD motif
MTVRLGALVLCLGLLVGCGDDEEPEAETATASATPTDEPTDQPTASPPESPPNEPSPTPAPAPGTRIVADGSEFGTMLYDDTGQAIYLFDVETTSEPRCYDACAEAWPPVLTKGEPIAGKGVEAARLGTVERADGAVQVTYGGHPLYFYAHEVKHEVLCHDVFLNGGNWYVVQPDGSAAPPG